MDSIEEKLEVLREYLKKLGSVAVAFSSGVDSTFLLKAALDTLGAENVIAVTASSCLFPVRELNEASTFCKENKIKHIVFATDELEIEGFCENPKNRCYLCKHEIFEQILKIAKENKMAAAAEGSNLDDTGDYRPGLLAVSELGIKSPLRAAKLNKEEIRKLSKKMGLPTWKKQSFACLASRFAYGEIISEKKLSMVDRAEQRLLDLGFHQLRVRIHGGENNYIARIELLPEEFGKLMEEETRTQVYNYLKTLGFAYVSLDLQGYRTGSMNETLEKEGEI